MPYKRGNYWYTNIRYNYQGKRGRIRQKIGPKRKDALSAEAQIRAALATGTYILPEDRAPAQADEPQRSQFGTFIREELLPWSQANHSANHHKSLRNMLLNQMVPQFGEYYLDEITTKHVEDFLIARRRLKGTTLNRMLMALRLCFIKAVEYGRLEANPTLSISRFTEIPNPPRLLSQGEVAGILREFPDHVRIIAALAAYSGLRFNEAATLKWSNVDSVARELTIIGKGQKQRRIPISDELMTHLRQHPRTLGSTLVCPNVRTGVPYVNIERTLWAAAERAGIADRVKMHQLRHAFCSHMQMEGVAASTVQKWMGHTLLTTTLRYTHVSPDYEKEAIQRLKYREDDDSQKQEHRG